MKVTEDDLHHCSRCGKCCQSVTHIRNGNLDRGDGVCRHYDEKKIACKIYDNRPGECRTEVLIKKFEKVGVPRDKYIQAHNECCTELSKIDKPTHEDLWCIANGAMFRALGLKLNERMNKYYEGLNCDNPAST